MVYIRKNTGRRYKAVTDVIMMDSEKGRTEAVLLKPLFDTDEGYIVISKFRVRFDFVTEAL